MLIDTHCHLDAPEFDADRAQVAAAARAAGVSTLIIPAVARENFDAVRNLAHALPCSVYALGIHPLFVARAREEDLADLDARLADLTPGQSASLAIHGEVKRGSPHPEPEVPPNCGGEAPTARLEFFTGAVDASGMSEVSGTRGDARLVAIGEIGLDLFVPELMQPPLRARQEFFLAAQLDMAQRHSLPVLLHVRRAQDLVLKHLRRRPRIGGIAHAFNGSFQQAQQFVDLGFVLGVGGAMTYARALQIRRLASQLPLSALTLETDAPDIAPAWLARPGDHPARNDPAQLARIARELARLRGVELATIVDACAQNARRVLPRLDVWLAGVAIECGAGAARLDTAFA